ncbi:MAG TPA: hypothetical protein VFH29_08245 [Anaerolineales bacterium]|nr:hypothetical protein [Anaerolineales bacterium]
MTADMLAGLAALLVTLMILSYLVGDSVLFRIAVSVFVGVAAGYVAVVAWWQVLLPRLLMPLLTGESSVRALLVVPFLLSGLLLMKAWPPLSRLGSPALGLLVGVASAVAVGGALQGTLWPQLSATISGMSIGPNSGVDGLFNGGLILVGLISSLAYFQFSAAAKKDGSIGRPWLINGLGMIGGFFIAITLGALYAGVFSAALTALIERMNFLWTFLGLG